MQAASYDDLYECEILHLEHQGECILTLTLRSEDIAHLFPTGWIGDCPLRLLVQPRLPAAHSVPEKSQSPIPRPELQQALEFIHNNLDSALSLQNVADAAGLSPRHFAHLFKEWIGEPPHRYVIRQRVEKAKSLLEQGKLSLRDVALTVGFYDQAHLTNNFKRLTGMTPHAATKGHEQG